MQNGARSGSPGACCRLGRGPSRRLASRFVYARTALAPGAHEEPGLDVALALDRDRAAGLALELVRKELVGRTRDLDPARRAVVLHAAGRVHRVAPEVVE